MRLQNKNFYFTLQDGDKPMSRLVTSSLVIDGKVSEILLSELFYGTKKEIKNSIRGYSILEFLDEKGNISINDKIYNLSFTGDKDNFILKSVSDPTNFILKDKDYPDEELKVLESKIESFGKIEAPVASDPPPQPQEEKTEEVRHLTDIQEVAGAPILFTSEEYNEEKENLKSEGFQEYQTEPISNYRLLVRDNKLALIELFEDDYEVLEIDDYTITKDIKTKIFTISEKDEVKDVYIEDITLSKEKEKVNVDN